MNMKLIKTMTGYKATNKNMTCRDFKFELGKWYEVEGDLVECKNGFHFCEQLAGVFAYYSGKDARVFKIEAQDVLDTPKATGTDYKRVCQRIRLVEEVKFNDKNKNTGNSNTGYWNTGNSNTGYWNTGNWNTGNSNTGNSNTGNSNTGYWNTGNSNTGDWNTGDGNTGNWNTGGRNTGNWNTGNRNTGDGNTGNRNTGDGNATNNSSGMFCVIEPKVTSFDELTEYTRDEFIYKFPEYTSLCDLLHKPEPIELEEFKNIPNITPKKLKALHKKHLAAKKS